MNYLFLFLLLMSGCSTGGSPSIEVRDAWIREPVASSDITALYFEIENRGSGKDSIISIDVPISDKAEIHNTIIDSKGFAKMVRLEEVVIPKNSSLRFLPGGMHIMLIGLNKEIKVGEEYMVNVNFKNSGNKRMTAKVRGFGDSMEKHMGR